MMTIRFRTGEVISKEIEEMEVGRLFINYVTARGRKISNQLDTIEEVIVDGRTVYIKGREF